VSREDLDVVRRGIEAYNRSDVDELVALSDPEVRMVPVKSLLEGDAYRGHEGVRRFIAEMDEDWSEREVLIDELRDLGDRILVLGRFRAVGRASGTQVDQPAAWVSEIRDGRLLTMQAYTDPEAALREAGAD
jgi:ketosteroid isomerase-like protein